MIIRLARIDEYAQAATQYKVCGYGGGIKNEDRVVIAVDEQIIGVVRICTEHDVNVLRGMQIKPAYQKQGIGSDMLKYLDSHMDMKGCYCLSYKHLDVFYNLIGFVKISPGEAPGFLAKRLEKYLSDGSKDIIIMKVPVAIMLR